MKRIVTLLSLLLFTTIGLTFMGCEKEPVDNTVDKVDPDKEEEIGIYGVKPTNLEISNLGGELSVAFLSLGDWSVSSDSDWCEVLTQSGKSGDAVVKIKVKPNPDDKKDRTAVLFVEVEGYKNMDLCEVLQSVSIENEITGNDANLWVSDYMSTHYLWNEEFNSIRPTLNHWIADPSSFLKTALSRMKTNTEDGKFYTNGDRYYYTALDVFMYAQGAPTIQTRAMSKANDYGINMIYPVNDGKGNYYYLVGSVVDESPAYYAGIKRGMYITKYNNAPITSFTLDDSYYALMGQSGSTDMVKLGLAQYKEQSDGGYILTDLEDVTVTPSTYTNNPIIFKAVFQKPDKPNVIGYMVYDEFDMNADEQVISLFKQFKSYNVTDLILDLRYNGGGDVYASAVMASAITGNSHKGDVYCHMEFNEYRKSRGEEEYFYIGEDPSMVEYPLVAEASATGLGLERVYVIGTGFTASASELIINGLRGLGLEVFVIGETTEGKNVGMEVIQSNYEQFKDDYDFGEYLYAFAPITFYNRNAQGFKDFAQGFKPDFEHIETSEIMFDWEENKDICVNAAAHHIYYGTWPELSEKSATRATSQLEVVKIDHLRPESRGSVVFSRDFIQSNL